MRSEQAQTPLLVSKREAASLLGICARTVENLIARKELPCRRIGRRTLIPFAALQQFAKRDHVTSTTGPEQQQQ